MGSWTQFQPVWRYPHIRQYSYTSREPKNLTQFWQIFLEIASESTDKGLSFPKPPSTSGSSHKLRLWVYYWPTCYELEVPTTPPTQDVNCKSRSLPGYRSEISKTPSSSWINLLERFIELRKTVYPLLLVYYKRI